MDMLDRAISLLVRLCSLRPGFLDEACGEVESCKEMLYAFG